MRCNWPWLIDATDLLMPPPPRAERQVARVTRRWLNGLSRDPRGGKRRATAVRQRTIKESSISAPAMRTSSHFSGLGLHSRSRLGSLCQVELWVSAQADAVCSQSTSEVCFSLCLCQSVLMSLGFCLILVRRYERFSCKQLNMFISKLNHWNRPVSKTPLLRKQKGRLFQLFQSELSF